ncbi:FlgD immunoglobulin-like domain containing protein [Streptomyces sp. NPDC057682]|uniref:FlgD immunoglobulin-like domain containing protein n=1 Tax=Streptomyces sp. NPDC057682 TaxID=3346210 RepID=UPI0036CED931
MSHHLRTTHRTRRTRTTATAAAVAAVLAAGLTTVLPATAHAAEAAEVAIPAPDAYAEGSAKLLATGRNGVLYREGDAYLWTNTYNSATTRITDLDGVAEDAIVSGHDGYNRVMYLRPREDGGTDIVKIGVEDPRNSGVTVVPANYLNLRIVSGWPLATVDQGDGTYQLRVVRGVGSPYPDPVVQLPAGATTGAVPDVVSGWDNQLLIRYRKADGTPGHGILTAYNGTVAPLPVEADATNVRITQTTISWYSRSGEPGVRIMQRGSSAAPRIFPLPTRSPDSDVTTYVVRESVAWREGDGPLWFSPLDGSAALGTPLDDIEQIFQGAEESTLFALGRKPDGDRAVRLLSWTSSGGVFALPLHEVPKVKTADGSIEALGLDRGRLRYVNALQGTRTLHGRNIGTGLDPVEGEPLPEFPGLAAGRFADGNDEGFARLVADPDSGADVLVTGDDPEHPADRFTLPGTDGRIVDTAPDFVLYEASGRQYVVDTVRDLIVREQPAMASVLDQKRLLKAAPNKPGTVNTINLLTGTVTRTTALGTACVPDELQLSGTLLYWACGASNAAGVRDLATGRTYEAPASGVLLGDHFLARREAGTGIRLTALLADGTTSDLGTVTDVKEPASGDGRGTTWTLDEAAGKLVTVGADDTVHITAPQQAVSALRVARTEAPPAWTGEWAAAWWLSKPAASWRLTLTQQSTGTVVRTWTGEHTPGTVRVTWDGTTDAGTAAPSGNYTWKLTATPADGTGADVKASGTVRNSG